MVEYCRSIHANLELANPIVIEVTVFFFLMLSNLFKYLTLLATLSPCRRWHQSEIVSK